MAHSERQPTKAQSVYEALRQQILTSALPAGAAVSERKLAERLGVGKAPVRVAIQRLAAEGFLTIEPRRGIRITEQSVQDVLELFQVRILMEQLVVRKLSGKLRPLQVARLYENLREFQAAAGASDVDAMIRTDFTFHRMLADYHGNRQLSLMLERIMDSLYREIRNTLQVRHRAKEHMDEHLRILDCMIQGDAPAAEEELVRHLQIDQRFVMSRGDFSLMPGEPPQTPDVPGKPETDGGSSAASLVTNGL